MLLPVSQFKLFDSAEHSLQVALLIFQHKSGQSLKHQGHVEHQNCVTGCHVTGLVGNTSERQSYSLNIFKNKTKALIFFFMLPLVASACTLGVSHIWRAPLQGTAAPQCSDICKISSGSSHTVDQIKTLNCTDQHMTKDHNFKMISHNRHLPSAQRWCTASVPRRCEPDLTRHHWCRLWPPSPAQTRHGPLWSSPYGQGQHLETSISLIRWTTEQIKHK